MPNPGVKLEESAARQRVVSKQAIDVLNIMAFIEIFCLYQIYFDLELEAMAVWFRPKKNMAGRVFTVERRAFNELKEVVYTVDQEVVYSPNGGAVYIGKEICINIEILNNDDLFVSSTTDGFHDGDEDLTGSVGLAVKLDVKKLPKQSDCRNGMLTFRLKNGLEYKFRCG